MSGSVLLAILRGLIALWPFIREMLFDGKSFRQVVKENKWTTGLVLALACSLAVNYISIAKIHEIAVARREDGNNSSTVNPVDDKKPIPTGTPFGGREDQKKADEEREQKARDALREHDETLRRLEDLYGDKK